MSRASSTNSRGGKYARGGLWKGSKVPETADDETDGAPAPPFWESSTETFDVSKQICVPVSAHLPPTSSAPPRVQWMSSMSYAVHALVCALCPIFCPCPYPWPLCLTFCLLDRLAFLLPCFFFIGMAAAQPVAARDRRPRGRVDSGRDSPGQLERRGPASMLHAHGS